MGSNKVNANVALIIGDHIQIDSVLLVQILGKCSEFCIFPLTIWAAGIHFRLLETVGENTRREGGMMRSFL